MASSRETKERTRGAAAPCALAAAASMLACSALQAQESQSASGSSTEAASSSQAQGQPAHTTEALQKATQNPVADLISVPLQNNVNLGIGPYNRIQHGGPLNTS